VTATIVAEPRTERAAPPVRFRDQLHMARKRFWDGTQRIRSPRETLQIIRPYFPRFGLTRLADVTGLDRIGIPVVLSIRPNGPFLSVDAGKGFTREAAMASAAMESIERYSGEHIALPEILASYEEMAARYPMIPIERLPLAKHAPFRPTWPVRWNIGWDLMAEQDVPAPSLLVGLDPYLPPRRELNPFQTGSNGLSSGNNFLEAVTGGLLEVIERDATTCYKVALERTGRTMPRVRLDTVQQPAARQLIDRLAAAGIAVVLLECTVDTGIPVYMSWIYDLHSRHLGLNGGYGAHLDPEIAMVRALTEAVQGRLVFIAGSRDDFFRHDYLRNKQGDDAALIAAIEGIPSTVDARTRPSLATPTFEGDIAVILDHLRAVGIDQALVFDLTPSGIDVCAVRVLIPGLEGYMFKHYTPGSRARRFIENAVV
jgi:ribosomal protein S12 methylthiotransferase accessory factor